MKIFFKLTPPWRGKHKNKGFTLIETMVAIVIFTLSILGLMSVLTQGIASTTYAKQRVVATFLAQEGIEYVRNMRDTFEFYDNVTPQHGWDAFKAKIAPSGNTVCAQAGSLGCYIDPQSVDYTSHAQPLALQTTATACGASCPELKYDSVTGKYGYATGINSGYTEKIVVTIVSADETKITSTVSWKQNSGVNSVVFSESVFNWVE